MARRSGRDWHGRRVSHQRSVQSPTNMEGIMRPSRDQWAMEMAAITAGRSTCLRRHVGAVLLDPRGHVIATGYNGVAAGLKHCNEYHTEFSEFIDACPGAKSPSGTNLDGCEAIHAEQNALLQCSNVHTISTCYATTSPCITCVKLLLNTSCRRIVFYEQYPHIESQKLWEKANREWTQYPQYRR